MSISTTRQELADALAGSGYSTYAYPKEVMFPPFITLVPSSPYISWRTPHRLNASYMLTLAVACNDNLAALENLEFMIESVIECIPAGVATGSFSEPDTEELNGITLLTTNIQLDVVVD